MRAMIPERARAPAMRSAIWSAGRTSVTSAAHTRKLPSGEADTTSLGRKVERS